MWIPFFVGLGVGFILGVIAVLILLSMEIPVKCGEIDI
jgi:hypothetical protein